ncbi:FISUMP domain-containing protein, partial [Ornithobacterium rhinotracheale]
PNGYHTPTEQELRNLHNTIVGKSLSGTNSSNSDKMWSERQLNLPAAGYRYDTNGSQFNRAGSYGYYWSSTQNGSYNAWELYFYSSNTNMNSISRSYGQPVRCLKD